MDWSNDENRKWPFSGMACMIQLTNRITMRIIFGTIFIISGFFGTVARADELSGVWKLDKTVEYFGDTKSIPKIKVDRAQIVNNVIVLPECTAKLEKKAYAYSETFQSLLKEHVSKEAFNKFMQKTFVFEMAKVDNIYTLEELPCSRFFDGAMVVGDTMVLAHSNSIFYSYTRATPGNPVPPTVSTKLNQRVSRLPFHPGQFMQACDAHIPRVKGVPQTTAKCAPAYYPYVARKTDADPLVQLIGSYKYVKAGPKYYADYDNPLANGMHPLFIVLPPLKDVLLVRVDDYDTIQNEQRDRFAGAYLAIKDGKVTDQLDDGCAITEAYACVDSNGIKLYQLLETGKFKKM